MCNVTLHIRDMTPGQDLRDEVAEQLEWIIDHVSALLPYTHRVWSACFYFKMGQDGRLYLLWCSSLHCEQYNKTHNAAGLFFPPHFLFQSLFLANTRSPRVCL